MSRAEKGGQSTNVCTTTKETAPACAKGTQIEFYDTLFESKNYAYVGGVVVHEVAHVINSQHCVPIVGSLCTKASLFFPGWDTTKDEPAVDLTVYARTNQSEYWAEALAVSVYGSAYQRAKPLNWLQERAIEWIVRK